MEIPDIVIASVFKLWCDYPAREAPDPQAPRTFMRRAEEHRLPALDRHYDLPAPPHRSFLARVDNSGRLIALERIAHEDDGGDR
ncbi:MAG TPA: hypothetical protein VFB31_14720 [Pseudolabrys sp.]|nr:hypothetical protein [Pseudolabrys sp.]